MRRLIRLSALVLLLSPCLHAEGEKPFQPLSALSKRLEAGAAAFQAGKTATEAFAPWTVQERPEQSEKLRADLKAVGATGLRLVAYEFELLLTKGDAPVYEVRALVGEAGGVVVLLSFEGRPAEGTISSSWVKAEDVTGEGLPAAEAGKALRAALEVEGAPALPFPDAAAFAAATAGMPEVDKLKGALDEQRKAVGQVVAAVKAAGADGWRVKLDDVTYKATAEGGAVVGTVRAEMALLPKQGLGFGLARFRPLKK